MTPTCWMDWCNKQTADLSRKLIIQGYDPATIERLRHTNRGFDGCFGRFERALGEISEAMVANPDGYHHYENLQRAKAELLEYTCTVRDLLVDDSLARTA